MTATYIFATVTAFEDSVCAAHLPSICCHGAYGGSHASSMEAAGVKSHGSIVEDAAQAVEGVHL